MQSSSSGGSGFRFEVLTFGGLLDRTFRIYGDQLVPTLTLSAMLMSGPLVLQALATYFVGRMEGALDTPEGLEALFSSPSNFIVVPIGLAWFASFLICTMWLNASINILIGQRYLGKPISEREALTAGVERLGAFVYTTIYVGTRAMLGAFLCVLPGLYWAFQGILAIPVTLLEGKSGPEAFNRSRELMVKDFWLGVGLVIVLSIITAMPGNIISLVVTLATGSQVVGTILGQVINLVTGPVTHIGLILLYFNVRIAREGYDLELLEQELMGQSGNTR